MTERLCWSLSDLCRVRGVPFEENRIGSRLSLAEVEDRPTTALVLAVYQSEGWGRPVPPSHCVAL